MEYFSFIGAIVACVLAIFKIIDLLKNRAILKISGWGGYEYSSQNQTSFHYYITFENIGRRPTIIREMYVDILDMKKKKLTISSTIKEINRKLDCPDIFEKEFKTIIEKKLPKEMYFIQAEIKATGKNYKLRIGMQHTDDIMGEIYRDIEKGREKGLLD